MNKQKKTTLDYNRMILRMVCAAVEKYPNWDFQKIMQNLEITKIPPNLDESSLNTLIRCGKYKSTLKNLGVKGCKLIVTKDNRGDPRVIMVTDFNR